VTKAELLAQLGAFYASVSTTPRRKTEADVGASHCYEVTVLAVDNPPMWNRKVIFFYVDREGTPQENAGPDARHTELYPLFTGQMRAPDAAAKMRAAQLAEIEDPNTTTTGLLMRGMVAPGVFNAVVYSDVNGTIQSRDALVSVDGNGKLVIQDVI